MKKVIALIIALSLMAMWQLSNGLNESFVELVCLSVCSLLVIYILGFGVYCLACFLMPRYVDDEDLKDNGL